MAYATTTDVEARLGRSLTAGEATQVSAWLDDAALLIDGFAPYTIPDGDVTPPAFVAVSANMAIRALEQGASVPFGVESSTEQVGPFGRTLRFGGGSGGGVWLSATDKAMLRPYRSGVTSVQLESERPGRSPYWWL